MPAATYPPYNVDCAAAAAEPAATPEAVKPAAPNAAPAITGAAATPATAAAVPIAMVAKVLLEKRVLSIEYN